MRHDLPVVMIVGLLMAGAVHAAEHGSPAEAKAMLAKAAEHYKAAGRKRALADFTAKKAPFSDRDLYVFCLGTDGTMSANGGYPSYVGMSVDVLKDADGKPLAKALLEAGAREGGGSVVYPLVNPVTHEPQTKVSFVQKLGEDVCGVGAFK